jgi:nicotinamidase-related amidase
LKPLEWAAINKPPEKMGVLVVDMTNGFCRMGNLASDRVEALIQPIVSLLTRAWGYGIRHIALLQDCHTAGAVEFGAFAEHALCGSAEAQAVDEIKQLDFYPEMQIIEKNSLHPAIGTDFNPWLDQASDLDTFIIVGDCTDLCVYQTAMHLRLTANAEGLDWRILIPENCVNTYDLPVAVAEKIGAQPHPGDFLHQVFLHHMALNQIEVYARIE